MELTATLGLNQAMAYVKSANNKNAITSATRVIGQPDHAVGGTVVKAYYWRATAYFNLGEYAQCKKDCVAAAKIDKANKSVRKLYKKATQAAKSSKAQIKKLYKGAFDKVHAGVETYEHETHGLWRIIPHTCACTLNRRT